MAPHIFCFANQKGGVGKTTTAVNVAVVLAHLGKRVLLVDTDPQTNATMAILGAKEPAKTIYNLYAGESLGDCVVPSPCDGLELLASTPQLAGAERQLAKGAGNGKLLRSLVRRSVSRYDFVVIDTPPSLSLLTVNALATSDTILVPVSASFFALKGLSELERTVDLVRERLDIAGLRIGGVLVTMFDHTNVARDVVEALKQRYGERLYQTIIPKNVKVEEAHSRFQSVVDYAPDSRGAEAYMQLAQEIVSRGH